jgi:hypothetical protein
MLNRSFTIAKTSQGSNVLDMEVKRKPTMSTNGRLFHFNFE